MSADLFPVHARRQDITRFLTRVEIFKQALDVHGSIVECGVRDGFGLFTWAQCSAIFEPFNHNRRVIGFDTFAGMAGVCEKDRGVTEEISPGKEWFIPINPNAQDGAMATDSEAALREAAKAFDANRPIGHIPKIELVRGDARETIPKYVADNPHLVVSLLCLDFDIYEPTKVALDCLLRHVPKGGIVAFDDINLAEWPGETQAAMEACGMYSIVQWDLKRFPWGSTMSYARVE